MTPRARMDTAWKLGFGLVAAFTLWRAWRMRYLYSYPDEGDAMLLGWMLNRGHHIYGEIFSNHMPVTYFLGALALKLAPGDDHGVSRLVPWACWVLAALSLVVSPALKDRGARPWIGAALFLLAMSLLGHHWWIHMLLPDGIWAAFMAVFFALYFLPAMSERAPGAGAAFLGGLAAAVAVFTSHLALITLSACAVFAAFNAGRQSRSEVGRAARACAAGAVLGGVLLLGAVAAWGSLPDFWAQAIDFNLNDYVRMGFNQDGGNPGLVMGELRGLVKQIGFLRTVRPFFFVCLLMSAFSLADGGRGLKGWALALGPALVVAFATVLRVGIRDMFVHDAPFFLLAAFLGAFAVARVHVVGKAWVWPVAAFAMLGGIYEMSNHGDKTWYRSEDKFAWEAPMKPMVDYVREHSLPEDKVAAANYAPIFYLLTQREPALASSGTAPWLEEWLKRSKWKMDSCEMAQTTRPKFVLLGSGYPWPSCFYTWLPKGYERVMKEGDLELWRLRPAGPATAKKS